MFDFISQYNIFERLPADCGVNMLSLVTDEMIILRRLTSQLLQLTPKICQPSDLYNEDEKSANC